MPFRLVSSGGDVTDPAVVNVYASGTIWPGGVVDFVRAADLGQGFVQASTKSSTQTQVFGIATAYVEGKSDAQVTVIPFAQGQVWEGDCINTVSTAQIGKRFSLSTAAGREGSVLLNNNAYDQSGSTGIFFSWNVSSVSTGSGKMIGEFIRLNSSVGQNSSTFN